MRLPSTKTLESLFPSNFAGEQRTKARQARRILEIADYYDLKDFAESIGLQLPQRAVHLDLREAQLEAISLCMEAHGVESLQLSGTSGFSRRDYACYINVGDTYATTLLRTLNGSFRVTSYGDYVETQERRGIHFK